MQSRSQLGLILLRLIEQNDREQEYFLIKYKMENKI